MITLMIAAVLFGVASAQDASVAPLAPSPTSSAENNNEVRELKFAICNQATRVEEMKNLVEICSGRIKPQGVNHESEVAADVPKITPDKAPIQFWECKKEYENAKDMLYSMEWKLASELVRLKCLKDDELVPYPPGVLDPHSPVTENQGIKAKYIHEIQLVISEQAERIEDKRKILVGIIRQFNIDYVLGDDRSEDLMKARNDLEKSLLKLEQLKAKMAGIAEPQK